MAPIDAPAEMAPQAPSPPSSVEAPRQVVPQATVQKIDNTKNPITQDIIQKVEQQLPPDVHKDSEIGDLMTTLAADTQPKNEQKNQGLSPDPVLENMPPIAVPPIPETSQANNPVKTQDVPTATNETQQQQQVEAALPPQVTQWQEKAAAGELPIEDLPQLYRDINALPKDSEARAALERVAWKDLQKSFANLSQRLAEHQNAYQLPPEMQKYIQEKRQEMGPEVMLLLKKDPKDLTPEEKEKIERYQKYNALLTGASASFSSSNGTYMT